MQHFPPALPFWDLFVLEAVLQASSVLSLLHRFLSEGVWATPVWHWDPVILTIVSPQLQWHLPPFSSASWSEAVTPHSLCRTTGMGSLSRKGHVKRSKGGWGGKSGVTVWQVFHLECEGPPLLPSACHFPACLACFLPYAIATPKESAGVWTMVIHLSSKHLLCGRQPKNWRWGLCLPGTCPVQGRSKHVN